MQAKMLMTKHDSVSAGIIKFLSQWKYWWQSNVTIMGSYRARTTTEQSINGAIQRKHPSFPSQQQQQAPTVTQGLFYWQICLVVTESSQSDNESKLNGFAYTVQDTYWPIQPIIDTVHTLIKSHEYFWFKHRVQLTLFFTTFMRWPPTKLFLGTGPIKW